MKLVHHSIESLQMGLVFEQHALIGQNSYDVIFFVAMAHFSDKRPDQRDGERNNIVRVGGELIKCREEGTGGANPIPQVPMQPRIFRYPACQMQHSAAQAVVVMADGPRQGIECIGVQYLRGKSVFKLRYRAPDLMSGDVALQLPLQRAGISLFCQFL